MKKALISLSLIIVFAFYALIASTRSNGSTVSEPISTTGVSSNPIDATTTSGASPIADKSPLFKDGVFTGPATDAYFGTIQVKATISGGKLSDIAFLQYPNDRGTSIRISTQSMPVLKSEAIRAQSAKVDIISGATQTSQAFIESLGSALADASK